MKKIQIVAISNNYFTRCVFISYEMCRIVEAYLKLYIITELKLTNLSMYSQIAIEEVSETKQFNQKVN